MINPNIFLDKHNVHFQMFVISMPNKQSFWSLLTFMTTGSIYIPLQGWVSWDLMSSTWDSSLLFPTCAPWELSSLLISQSTLLSSPHTKQVSYKKEKYNFDVLRKWDGNPHHLTGEHSPPYLLQCSSYKSKIFILNFESFSLATWLST